MKSDRYITYINQILITLVLYKRKLTEVPAFQSLQLIASKNSFPLDLAVYDNSPEAMNKQEIDKYRSIHIKEHILPSPKFPLSTEGIKVGYYKTANHNKSGINIIYIHDASNPGLSKAYNEGYKLARKSGKKWLLLLDQDTHFTEDLFFEYGRAIHDQPDTHLFAPVLIDHNKIISPYRYFLRRGFIIHHPESGIHSLKKYSLINSAMLISIVSFEKIGGFNEKIRLDFVDLDFLARFKKYYPDFYLLNYQCQHHFSSISNKNKQELVLRYKYYCNSAHLFSNTFWTYFFVMFWVIIRGFRLFFRYKNIVFFKIFVQYYLLKKEPGEEHN